MKQNSIPTLNLSLVQQEYMISSDFESRARVLNGSQSERSSRAMPSRSAFAEEMDDDIDDFSAFRTIDLAYKKFPPLVFESRYRADILSMNKVIAEFKSRLFITNLQGRTNQNNTPEIIEHCQISIQALYKICAIFLARYQTVSIPIPNGMNRSDLKQEEFQKRYRDAQQKRNEFTVKCTKDICYIARAFYKGVGLQDFVKKIETIIEGFL